MGAEYKDLGAGYIFPNVIIGHKLLCLLILFSIVSDSHYQGRFYCFVSQGNAISLTVNKCH